MTNALRRMLFTSCRFHLLAWTLTVGLQSPAMSQEAFRSELIFPLNSQHNHAPGIVELPDHSLFVSWYRGSSERKADDVAVYGARRPAGALTWTEPVVLVDTPGFPDCNTCLFLDPQKRLWLFWPIVLANSWESCLTQYLVADEDGYRSPGVPKWSQQGTLWLKPDDFREDAIAKLDRELTQVEWPRNAQEQEELKRFRELVGDKLFQRLGWQPRCKPIQLDSGRILLPLYSDTYSMSLMAISDDGGSTWRASKPLIGFGNIQPTLFQRKDGAVVAYMRENGPRLRIRMAISNDRGETWGDVHNSDLPNPGAGIDGVRLQNGHWAMVYNDTEQERNSLAIAISTDEGQSWSAKRHLEHEPKGAFHYPTVIQSEDGRIHVVYSYFVDGGKSMKHAELTEEWIVSGDRSP